MAADSTTGQFPPTAAPAVSAAIDHVRARGALTDADVVTRGVRVLDVSRSHTVLLVEVDGRPALVVKELPGDDVQGSGRRETAAYALAEAEPALAGLLPRWHGPDAGGRWLVADAVAGEAASDRLLRSGMRDEPLAAGIGRALGSWHRHAAAGGLPPTRPWILDAAAADRPAFLDSNEGARAFLVDALRRPVLPGVLAAAAAAWTATTTIHGDLRLDNCLVPVGGVAPVLIDWETAGRGDPAWDVAAVAQELLTLPGGDRLDEIRGTVAGCLRAFLRAYGASAGDGVSRRLPELVAARVLQRAVQVASWNPAGRSVETDRLVSLAEQVAATGGSWWEPA